jgi:hypothetical protein
MQGLKGVIVVATIVAAAVALGGCFHHEKAVTQEPLKLGSADVVVEQVVRVYRARNTRFGAEGDHLPQYGSGCRDVGA